MKRFVITAESDLMEVELRTNDWNEACEIFQDLCGKEDTYAVDFYDGETGELYAYQKVEKSPYGITATRWVAR